MAVVRSLPLTASAQALLQGFGVEQMFPDGSRVSSLQTEGDSARERATVSARDGWRWRVPPPHTPALGGREVRELRSQRAIFLLYAGMVSVLAPPFG